MQKYSVLLFSFLVCTCVFADFNDDLQKYVTDEVSASHYIKRNYKYINTSNMFGDVEKFWASKRGCCIDYAYATAYILQQHLGLLEVYTVSFHAKKLFEGHSVCIWNTPTGWKVSSNGKIRTHFKSKEKALHYINAEFNHRYEWAQIYTVAWEGYIYHSRSIEHITL